MSTSVLVRGTGWAGGQWPPKLVGNAPASGTVTGISSSRPFDVQLYDGDNAATLIYSGGMNAVAPPYVPNNGPVNNAAFSITGLSIAYTAGLWLFSKSGSDLTITVA